MDYPRFLWFYQKWRCWAVKITLSAQYFLHLHVICGWLTVLSLVLYLHCPSPIEPFHYTLYLPAVKYKTHCIARKCNGNLNMKPGLRLNISPYRIPIYRSSVQPVVWSVTYYTRSIPSKARCVKKNWNEWLQLTEVELRSPHSQIERNYPTVAYDTVLRAL